MADKESMIVKYWGLRGSIPAPLTTEQIRDKETVLIEQIAADGGIEKLFGKEPDQEKIQNYLETLPLSLSGTYGGDTTCVEIQVKDSPLIIFDVGSGARALGNTLVGRLFSDGQLNPLNSYEDTSKNIHLFFTHYHWDHIQGFPFFVPGFLSGENKINIDFYGKQNGDNKISDVLRGQQEYPTFPVTWEDMPFEKRYHELSRTENHEFELGNAIIRSTELAHPDGVFAYSVQVDDKKFVFATDTEHKDRPDPRLVNLAKDADFMYYDAHYTPEEYEGGKSGLLTGFMPKFDWGHSTYEWAVKNALAANVKTVVLGHIEPLRDDFGVEQLHEAALEYCNQQLKLPENKDKHLVVIMGHQGMEHRL